MQINYDKWKHTIGVLALAGMYPAMNVPKWGHWIAIGLGAVAFMCGVQSEKMFTKQAEDDLAVLVKEDK